MKDISSLLAPFERVRLLSGPTAIEKLERLSTHLGIDLWIKRDDLAGLGGGGNKFRQLEYYFGAAQAQGADTILITGAVQSNYVRAAAAVAAKLGMGSVLQLEERVPNMLGSYRTSGNVVLSNLLGATLIYYDDGEDETGADRQLHEHAKRLRDQGRRPYVIPLGLNNKPLGSLGYINAAHEILDQADPFDAIVLASGSGATHCGLLTGMRLLGNKTPVYGICVRRERSAQTQRLTILAEKIAEMLGLTNIVSAADIHTWDEALAPGYGQLGESGRIALQMMAQYEGLFLDPVYTAKAFAGLLGLIENKTIASGMRVLFLHTGGVPSLFAYPSNSLLP